MHPQVRHRMLLLAGVELRRTLRDGDGDGYVDPDGRGPAPDKTPWMPAAAAKVFGGRFGNLEVRVTSVTAQNGRLHVAASLHDDKGRRVGGIRRVVGDRGGVLTAEHATRFDRARTSRTQTVLAGVLTGAPPLSGMPRDEARYDAALAAYDAHLDGWYRSWGVRRVLVHARSPYWAQRGDLDWADGIPPELLARLRRFASSARPIRRAEARRILARLEAGERVSPQDIAALISGPELFDGIAWVGVRQLPGRG